jgi:hypothetical protein
VLALTGLGEAEADCTRNKRVAGVSRSLLRACMRKRALQGCRRVVPGYFDAVQRSAGGNTAGIDKPGQGEYALNRHSDN